MPSISPFSTQRSTSLSASSLNVARSCVNAFGLRIRERTALVCVCIGGSTSRIRLLGLNGGSLLKFVRPTPAPEMNAT